jgi:hypothetical protein
MSRTKTDIAELATANLHYALAELTSIGDAESVLRALDHIRQAQACLEIGHPVERAPRRELQKAAPHAYRKSQSA